MDIDALLEAERRGILPEDKKPLLAEARRRGLVGNEPQRNSDGTYGEVPEGMIFDPRTQRYVDVGAMADHGMTRGKAAAAGAGQGVSFGFMDEAVSGLYGVSRALRGEDYGDSYDYALERRRAEIDAAREQYPATTMVSEIGGAVVAPGAAAKGAASILGSAGRGAMSGGIGGALYGFGQSEGGVENRVEGARNVGTIGALVGGAAGAAIPAAARASQKAASRRAAQSATRTAPSTDDLARQGDEVYRSLDARNVRIRPDSFEGLAQRVRGVLDGEGATAAPGLSKTANSALRAIENRVKNGGSLTLKQLDSIRRITNNIPRDASDDAIRHARLVRNEIDDFVYNLVDGDLMSGRADNLGAEIKRARDLWKRMKQSGTIQEAIERAQDAASGFENGLRVEFRKLLKDKALMKTLPDEAVQAIREVTQGTALGNTLKKVSRIGFGLGQQGSSLTGMLASGAGAGAGGAVGGPLGAVVGATAPAVVGRAASKGAERATLNAANRAAGVAATGAQAMPPAVARNTIPKALSGAQRALTPLESYLLSVQSAK